ARRGSRHGYDVIDPRRLNPELGTDADWRALADALHAHDMGLLLDIVPNHMAVSAQNPYWDSVLARGERSPFARWFDIDWAGTPDRRLVLPLLGDEPDAAIASGDLAIRFTERGEPRVAYYDHSFPIAPETL